jgi:thiamine-monophosphate kinase
MTSSGSEPNRPGEFALIAELFVPLATAPGAFCLSDDAAIVMPPPGHDLVVTADTLVEGVHFFASDPPDLIAQKALRVNLSDLAAKGCVPAGYLLALSLPSQIEMPWLRAFASGLATTQRDFGISLLGGDTTATPGPLSITVTAFGQVPAGAMLRRSGAHAGDVVLVSGTIGDAGGGLACLRGEGVGLSDVDREFLVHRFRRPEPRLALGQALIGLASASIDISDGLLADLRHLADTSSARIEIDAARVPLSPALAALWPDETDRIIRAATAGDDYELAFAVPPENCAAVVRSAGRSGIPIAQIGVVKRGKGVTLRDSTGRPIPVSRPGYVHF